MADDLRPLAYQHYMSAIGFALPDGARISPRRIALAGGMDGVGLMPPARGPSLGRQSPSA